MKLWKRGTKEKDYALSGPGERWECKVRHSKWNYFCPIRGTGRMGLKPIGQKTKKTKVEYRRHTKISL